MPGPFDLDGRSVELITAFLFHAGSDDDPHRLPENAAKSFQGSIVLGMGFTFDDTDKSGVANPTALMHELIAKDPRNAQRIFPYIGGEEVNDSPTHAHHRFVIDFRQMSEEQAREWPDLWSLLEAKVRPERQKVNREAQRVRWWQHGEARPGLYRAIQGLARILVHPFTSPHLAFAFVPATTIVAGPHNVLVADSNAFLGVVQSRVHEVWARVFASSFKDDLRYTPSDCFETFPFPPSWDVDPALEASGRSYYQFRAALMARNGEGLTKTYNRFHDPDEDAPSIQGLRDLHGAMDRAVLDAYGWTDIPTTCEFVLDHEDDEQDEPGKASRRKKPWRYRWPDEVRDTVLGRLLDLNERSAKPGRPSGFSEAKTAGATEPLQRRKSGTPLLDL